MNRYNGSYILFFFLAGMLIVSCRDRSGNMISEPALPPVIESIEPDSGKFGDIITITGRNFADNASDNIVTFNNKRAVITFVSPTSINAKVPKGAGEGIVEISTFNQIDQGPTFKYLLSWSVSTFAGSGISGFADGEAESARFRRPTGVAIGPEGFIYVADAFNHRIRKISKDGTVTTLAGSGIRGYQDGYGEQAKFNVPTGLTISDSGTIFVADFENHLIRKVTKNGTVSTFAGNGEYDFKDGTVFEASFRAPESVDIDEAGNLYVADRDNHAIRKISPAGDVSTIAGTGNPGFQNGSKENSEFNFPLDISAGKDGFIYVADVRNHRVRRISENYTVTTYAGSGTPGFADGSLLEAQFNSPISVDVSDDGEVFVSDNLNDRIRLITTAGEVELLAGSGAAGHTDGLAEMAEFFNPFYIAVNKEGNVVYVADNFNNVIRELTFE